MQVGSRCAFLTPPPQKLLEEGTRLEAEASLDGLPDEAIRWRGTDNGGASLRV